MKLRTDFVTNSSSSSFIVVNIKSNKLKEIFEKYEEFLKGIAEYCCMGEIDFSEGISMNEDETGYCSSVPSSIDDVVDCLITLIEEFQETYYDEDMNSLEDLIEELKENAEAIKEDITEVEWTYGDVGWGGDSESRYEESNYDEESLEFIYEQIMAEHGYTSKEQITEYDFNMYVGSQTSNEETTFHYNKAENISEHYHTFELL